MKRRVIYNATWLGFLPGSVYGMALYPFLFFRESRDQVSDRIFKHENIHFDQVERVGFLFFYSSYLYYFIRNYFHLRDWREAYMAIPYEAEAYAREHEPLNAEQSKFK